MYINTQWFRCQVATAKFNRALPPEIWLSADTGKREEPGVGVRITSFRQPF